MQKQTGQTSYIQAFKLPVFTNAQKLSLWFGVISFANLLFVIWSHPVQAQLSFGFEDNGDVAKGMIVSVSQDNTDTIERAHVNNAQYVFGVAIDQASSSVAFDQQNSAHVATEGTVDVFVSTIGGNIASGDLITLSNIGGVGKKSGNDSSQVIIGIAKSDFTDETPNAREVSLQSGSTTVIGVVRMELLLSTRAENDSVNVFVQIGQRIVGKPVTVAQVIVAATVLIIGFVVSGSILFGSVKGSFVSIGRNPLSADSIYHGMARVSLLSVGLIVISLMAGYVVLAV